MKTGFIWLGQEAPLLVQPTLAKIIGLHEAIFLQKLDYWLQCRPHLRDDRHWIYNTYEEWQNQIPFLSVRTLKRVVSTLREKGIIETTDRYNGRAADRTLWYTICYETVQKICGIPHSDNSSRSEVEGASQPDTPGQVNLSLFEVEAADHSVTSHSDNPSRSEGAGCPDGPSKVTTDHPEACQPDTLHSATDSPSSIYTNITTKKTTKKTTTTESEDVVVVALITHGLSKPIALGFAEKYAEEYLCEKMAFLDFEKKRCPDLANPAGWLRRAIEEDFAPPPGYQTPEQEAAATLQESQMVATQCQEYDAIREQQQAQIAAQLAQQLAILQPRYGTTESLLTAWAEGRTYAATVIPFGLLAQAMDQTVLVSFADGHAQIGVWDQVALPQLELRGKQLITEALAYAMRDALDGRSGTYELVFLAEE